MRGGPSPGGDPSVTPPAGPTPAAEQQRQMVYDAPSTPYMRELPSPRGESDEPTSEGILTTMAPLLELLGASMSALQESWARLQNAPIHGAVDDDEPPPQARASQRPRRPAGGNRGAPAHGRAAPSGQRGRPAAGAMGGRPHATRGHALIALQHGPLTSTPFAVVGGGQRRTMSRPSSASKSLHASRLPRVGSAPPSRLVAVGSGSGSIYEI